MLAQLVGSSPEQIVLGNSTSYGLHLVANGLDWQDGDEVLVIEGDYPATILPWQRLAQLGVRVRPLRPAGELLSAAELTAAIGPRTRLLAGIDIAYREGNLRVSVHLFNEPAEIDRALAVLHQDGPR